MFCVLQFVLRAFVCLWVDFFVVVFDFDVFDAGEGEMDRNG